MSGSASERARRFYAETYDVTVSDWPNEIDFYRGLAAKATKDGRTVLELACGTGRVAIRLAEAGATIVGLDLSEAMLEVARTRNAGVRWVLGDMRSFDLGETFGLVIIPGHAFQNLTEADDQAACLASIRQHLDPGGRLVVHLDRPDIAWLGDIASGKSGVFEAAGEFDHPRTGWRIRTLQAWSYEPLTETAISETVWEAIDEDGRVTERWETGPVRIRCVFRYEMEHLLARAGFDIETVFGDFAGGDLTDESTEMIWIAGLKETWREE